LTDGFRWDYSLCPASTALAVETGAVGSSSNPGGQAVTQISLVIRGVQFLVAGAAFVGALLIPAGAAQARATVFSFSDTPTQAFSAPAGGLSSCGPRRQRATHRDHHRTARGH